MENPSTPPAEEGRNDRAERWEKRLAWPVIIAAAAAVPAVFLTNFTDGWSEQAGHALNWASLGVLIAESALLYLLAGDRRRWLREHKWPITVALLTVPAVVFALGPAQVLRIVLRLGRLFSAFRILRAQRIVKAGKILGDKSRLSGRRRYIPIGIGVGIAAVFVGALLADPSAVREHRQVLAEITGWTAVIWAGIAGAGLVGAAYLLLRLRRR